MLFIRSLMRLGSFPFYWSVVLCFINTFPFKILIRSFKFTFIVDLEDLYLTQEEKPEVSFQYRL